jgi:hypothetical protein
MNPKQTRIHKFPNRKRRCFQRGKGRGDRGDCFPSINSAEEGKERPDLEGNGGGAKLGFRAAAAEGGRRTPPVSGRRARAAADWAGWAEEREKRFWADFRPKAKRRLFKPFSNKIIS